MLKRTLPGHASRPRRTVTASLAGALVLGAAAACGGGSAGTSGSGQAAGSGKDIPTVRLMVGGIAAGFLLFFLSNLVAALGQTGAIPVLLAAWAPAIVSTLLGLTMLLHLEDG